MGYEAATQINWIEIKPVSPTETRYAVHVRPDFSMWYSRRSRGVLIHATFRQLRNGRFSPNLVTKRISVSRRGIRKYIFENFHFKGHFPPKSEIETRSNRHLTQSSLQVTGCTAERYCCSPRARDFPRYEQLFSTTYGCGAMEHQSCPILGFWPIFPY